MAASLADKRHFKPQNASLSPENERNPSSSTFAAGSSSAKTPKSRHRASVACASCRDRRIRCVVPAGENECEQCKRAGVQCVIKNDDERRRPISRAYMCSLTERVSLLEALLREHNIEPPPAHYPPKTRHGNGDAPLETPTSVTTPANYAFSHPILGSLWMPKSDSIGLATASSGFKVDQGNFQRRSGSPSTSSVATKVESDHGSGETPPKRMITRLLSTKGHLSLDQLSGRLRYFGPTTNCHVHEKEKEQVGTSTESSAPELDELEHRAAKVVRQLSADTQDYLLDLFFTHYNRPMPIVHRDAFMEHRERGGRTPFYSGFLHICALAMGFRYADKRPEVRPDIARIALPGRESTLHREAKYMLDIVLERPVGVPVIVALLLLGDLECCVGRDNIGWLYAGIAIRLAFDIGLHLDHNGVTSLNFDPQEAESRRLALWSCVIYDKYWALFLGRPLAIKTADIQSGRCLIKQFERLGTSQPAGSDRPLESQIYEALLDLMELAGKVAEENAIVSPNTEGSHGSGFDRVGYIRMASLDREFHQWYAALPETLRWTDKNIETAPFSFFMLHQQYHTLLIMLHRPFARYDDSGLRADESTDAEVKTRSVNIDDTDVSSDNEDNLPLFVSTSSSATIAESTGLTKTAHFSTLSRTICTQHAIRVARIFATHRRRFDTRMIFVTGMQHAGTAATALVAALAFIKNAADREANMHYLEVVAAALQDMAHTFQPAERMSAIVQEVMQELRMPTSPSPVGATCTALLDNVGKKELSAEGAFGKSASSVGLIAQTTKKLIDDADMPLPYARTTTQTAFGQPFNPGSNVHSNSFQNQNQGSSGGAPNLTVQVNSAYSNLPINGGASAGFGTSVPSPSPVSFASATSPPNSSISRRRGSECLSDTSYLFESSPVGPGTSGMRLRFGSGSSSGNLSGHTFNGGEAGIGPGSSCKRTRLNSGGSSQSRKRFSGMSFGSGPGQPVIPEHPDDERDEGAGSLPVSCSSQEPLVGRTELQPGKAAVQQQQQQPSYVPHNHTFTWLSKSSSDTASTSLPLSTTAGSGTTSMPTAAPTLVPQSSNPDIVALASVHFPEIEHHSAEAETGSGELKNKKIKNELGHCGEEYLQRQQPSQYAYSSYTLPLNNQGSGPAGSNGGHCMTNPVSTSFVGEGAANNSFISPQQQDYQPVVPVADFFALSGDEWRDWHAGTDFSIPGVSACLQIAGLNTVNDMVGMGGFVAMDGGVVGLTGGTTGPMGNTHPVNGLGEVNKGIHPYQHQPTPQSCLRQDTHAHAFTEPHRLDEMDVDLAGLGADHRVQHPGGGHGKLVGKHTSITTAPGLGAVSAHGPGNSSLSRPLLELDSQEMALLECGKDGQLGRALPLQQQKYPQHPPGSSTAAVPPSGQDPSRVTSLSSSSVRSASMSRSPVAHASGGRVGSQEEEYGISVPAQMQCQGPASGTEQHQQQQPLSSRTSSDSMGEVLDKIGLGTIGANSVLV